jgi:hypothetical protein
VQGIVEFLHLVEIVNVPTLLPDTEDSTSWKFTNTLPNRKHMMPCSRNNQLTTLEIYLGRLGAGKVQGVVWLALSLATSGRQGAGFRHGLPDDDTCALCDQECESISHLMTSNVRSTETSKMHVLTGLPGDDFRGWFENAYSNTKPHFQKRAKSSIILSLATLKMPNDYVVNDTNTQSSRTGSLYS